ncbi:MAG: TetR/AcrR family transcriptional regulator [Novosphingobium sp.]
MQDRSQASLERMVQAALTLMMERASEDFTLLEVSQLGKVSIGSIYHRFRSKDDLVRAVIARGLADIGAIEQLRLGEVLEKSRTVDEFIPRFVDLFARTLREHAPMLRLAMRRAAIDVEVSEAGDSRERNAAEALAQALLSYDDEIAGDAVVKGRLTLQVIFAALARYLSLNTTQPKLDPQDWDSLIRELSIMALAYLKSGATNAHGKGAAL